MIENISPAMRRQLVGQLVNQGCKPAHAEEIIDLAAHAVDQAIETVTTVCKQASCFQTMASSHQMAFALLSATAEVHGEGVTKAVEKTAGARGINVTKFSFQ